MFGAKSNDILKSSCRLPIMICFISLITIIPSLGWADLAIGTEYLSFWSGDLRIFAHKDNTEVLLIDIATGLPLALSDQRIDSVNVSSNPFVLASAGDSFEGIGGLGLQNNEIRVRIVTSDATGGTEKKSVTVWTGYLGTLARHPLNPPNTSNPWMSYIPAFNSVTESSGTEVGRDFLGFTSREMYIFAQKGTEPTSIYIQDLATNTDTDTDDTITLLPTDAIYADLEIEVYFLDAFEDDTVLVTSNVDASVLVGVSSKLTDDWTVTPPSYAAGDDGIELGTLFYTFAHQSLTVFPIQDATHVTITDLSDADDSRTVFLANGDTIGDYDLYTPSSTTINYGDIIPRTSSPAVNIIDNGGNWFDDDFVKIESDKPILVYVGPVGSNVNEFADVAFSVPTGPDSRIIYTYAQNSGGSNDLQIFSFSQDTVVTVTSLSYTDGFRLSGYHDFIIGPGIGPDSWKQGTVTGDVWWGSDVWNGEMLRIESTKPVTVINGDYDFPTFGAFIPFTLSTPTLPPVAVALAIPSTLCAGDSVSFDGSGSYDQDTLIGGGTPTYVWDFDVSTDSDSDGDPANDVDATGPAPVHAFPSTGVFTVRLTFTDDDGQSDTDFVDVTVEPCLPECMDCQGGVTQLTLLYTSSEGTITVYDDNDRQIYGPMLHTAGDAFTFSGANPDGTMGTRITINVDGQEDAGLYTDCCLPDVSSQMMMCPPPPPPPPPSCQPMGIGLVVRGYEVIGGSSLDGGVLCPLPACSDCEGGVVRLTLRYTGVDGNVRVETDSNEVLFEGALLSGETFTFNGPPSDGVMGSQITIYVNNVQNTSINTDCLQPIGDGLASGDFEVVEGYSFIGGKLPMMYPCISPSDCDDGNLCTDDVCDECGSCTNIPNTNLCDDGDACTMNDMCTDGTCSGQLLDEDGDTYYSAACGGDDCNDSDLNINPGTFEICNNLGVDEDCDGLIDNNDPDCKPSYPQVANNIAASYGKGSLIGSGSVNALIIFIIPIGAMIFLRVLHRKIKQ